MSESLPLVGAIVGNLVMIAFYVVMSHSKSKLSVWETLDVLTKTNALITLDDRIEWWMRDNPSVDTYSTPSAVCDLQTQVEADHDALFRPEPANQPLVAIPELALAEAARLSAETARAEAARRYYLY